jgi:ribonuclease HII
MIVGGVDEAGRGPVVGPLVVAGLKCHEEDRHKWKEWGVKDSKLLSKNKRLLLYRRLTEYYPYKVVSIEPPRIDQAVMSMKRTERLNYLEATAFAQVISALTVDSEPITWYIDACDSNATRFGNLVYNFQTGKRRNEVFSRHHMDRDEIVVGAASVIAKVERDMAIERLKNDIGVDFGSGYPGDKKTRAFLLTLDRKNLPNYIRKSWRTWSRLK